MLTFRMPTIADLQISIWSIVLQVDHVRLSHGTLQHMLAVHDRSLDIIAAATDMGRLVCFCYSAPCLTT